jgi:hypothetical protein
MRSRPSLPHLLGLVLIGFVITTLPLYAFVYLMRRFLFPP